MDSEFSNIPNWHGLPASDFDFDMDSYTVALRFLGDVSIGTLEEDALRIEGGTPEMRRSWESSRRFRRSLGKRREMGEQDRAHAARLKPDPFATPPRRGAVDLAAVEYDPQAEAPRGGLGGWLRRIGVIADRQAQPEEPRPSGQREISFDEMTDRDWAAVRYQGAEAQRVRAEQGLEGQQGIGWWTPPGVVWRVPGVQQWDGTGISPDGTRVEQ